MNYRNFFTITCLSLALAACSQEAEITKSETASNIASTPKENKTLTSTLLTPEEIAQLKEISTNPDTQPEDIQTAKNYLADSAEYSIEEVKDFLKKIKTESDKKIKTKAKINFLKKVYADEVNMDLMGVDIVKLHGSKELRQLIEKRDAIADRNEGDMCDWVRTILIPGNDFDVKTKDIKYSELNNGRIRVQAYNFGEKFTVDFDVTCTENECKISDIFDPKSYKNELKDIIKQNVC